MGKKIFALVKPELLIWARVTAGLTQEIASQKAKVSLDQIRSWEDGESSPSVPQLIKLGKTYKRPISVFYLPKPPKHFDALHDYRRLPGQPLPSQSPALIYEIRKARERRQIALDLYELLGNQPPEVKFKISLGDKPEQVSEGIRAFLRIDVETQVNWRSIHEAYNEWRRALEAVGILSFQSTDNKIKLSEMRGFSLSEKPLPVIVINKEDFPAPRIFSLIHELSHILLGQEGICEFDEISDPSNDDQKNEIFCNHVAGAVLVPKESFVSEDVVKQSYKMNSVDDIGIRALANKYYVSREVILRRLLHFGFISPTFYAHKKEVYEGEAKKSAKEKALRMAKEDKRFVVPVYVKTINSNGRNLTGLILTSYYQQKITLNDVSSYLGVKVKHLPNIEKAMSRSYSFA